MSMRLPTYFISHGGGPWPWVPSMRELFSRLEGSLVEMVAALPERPRAVLMISGHWEADEVRVMTSPRPPMVYDYQNFPKHTYEIVYPSPGAPEVADRVLGLLHEAGIVATPDHEQGYDHGVYVPMDIMYPDADMPLMQLSLLKTYDPASHLDIGRAIASLRDEGVLIIGSGLSYHNLRLMGPQAKVPSAAFDRWLDAALKANQADRTRDLLNWELAPYARVCHAEEDHLLPLFVALGAAECEVATRIYHEADLMGGVTASGYRFG